MSKKWLWLTMVWAEHNDLIILIIAWIIVGAVSGVGLLYARANHAGWAQVLVLGITTLAVVWYAHEARRQAKSAEDQAESTRRMASAAWSPNVLLCVDHDAPQDSSRVFNDGPGPARELGIVANHKNSPQLLSWYVPPKQYVPIIRNKEEIEDLLNWAMEGGDDRYVSLCWCDITGQWLHLKWRYIDDCWVCEGCAPEECDVWIEHIKRT